MADTAAEDPAPRQRPTLAALDARLAVLERGKPQTPAEKLARQGALIALVLSITTGAYTIYDNFWARPHERKVARAEQDFELVQRTLQQISATNQALAQIPPGTNRAVAQQTMLAALAQKRSQLAIVLPLVDRVADRLTTSDYYILSGEEMTAGDPAASRKFAEAAVTHARNPYERLEALRNRGAAQFISGDPDAGRASFAAAAAAGPGDGLAPNRAVVYGNWAAAEAMSGNCPAVDGLLRHFAADMARVGNPDVQLNISAMVRQQLAGQRRCRWDDALLGGASDTTQP